MIQLGKFALLKMGISEIIPDILPEGRDPSEHPVGPDGYYEEYDEEYSSRLLFL